MKLCYRRFDWANEDKAQESMRSRLSEDIPEFFDGDRGDKLMAAVESCDFPFRDPVHELMKIHCADILVREQARESDKGLAALLLCTVF